MWEKGESEGDSESEEEGKEKESLLVPLSFVVPAQSKEYHPIFLAPFMLVQRVIGDFHFILWLASWHTKVIIITKVEVGV